MIIKRSEGSRHAINRISISAENDIVLEGFCCHMVFNFTANIRHVLMFKTSHIIFIHMFALGDDLTTTLNPSNLFRKAGACEGFAVVTLMVGTPLRITGPKLILMSQF